METIWDVAIIGAGPAGLAAAVAAKEAGAEKVVVIERDSAPGGILQQCIHPGFGLTKFNEELTGPEYAGIYIDRAKELGVEFLLDTMVLSIAENEIYCVGKSIGCANIRAKSVILAMGCRERTRGSLVIPGTRPAGIYTAGAAQRLLNRQGIMPGKRFVIIGSGDIGMIMARRLTLEGGKVEAVVELMSYTAGLTRNLVQCLNDFGIPLLTSHTVTNIIGRERVEAVEIAEVDGSMKPVPGTERRIDCDTVLLSVGLIPENELSRALGIELSPVTRGPKVNQFRQTNLPWVFACGNVTHVNDLADNVSMESETAGRSAALYAKSGTLGAERAVATIPGKNVRYICPQTVCAGKGLEEASLYFRVTKPLRRGCITVRSGGEVLLTKKSPKLNPGEMAHVTLDSAMLERLSDDIMIEAEGE